VAELLARSGSRLSADDPLVRSRDPELEFELSAAAAHVTEIEALRRSALRLASADLATIDSQLEAVKRRIEHLEQRKRDLVIHAPHAGFWTAPELEDMVGTWVPRGTPFGRLVSPAAFRFSAIIPQKEASRLFADEIRAARVRLKGEAARPLGVVDQRIIPAQQERLPSAALGWLAGGEVAVQTTDAEGVKAAEPFFEVLAEIEPRDDVALLHGRTGRIRFTLNPEPLLNQWGRKLRQLIQRTYQL
jgi:putative peptide zinc metalloprotease protein